MGKFLRYSIIFFIAVFVFVVVIRLSLPALGDYLVVEDSVESADAIVVLMGTYPDRILGALDLYNEGVADKIIMVSAFAQGYDVIVERGIDIPLYVDLNVDVAVMLGADKEDIIVLPGDALCTGDEALAVRDYIEVNSEIENLVLVTSKDHSRRAKIIFENAMKSLDRDITILSSPTKYDNFDSSKWWKTREDLKRGVTEYIKLVNFCLFERSTFK